MLVFNFKFDWLWTRGGSSVTSVAFLGFRELKYVYIEKPGPTTYFPTFPHYLTNGTTFGMSVT
jgi:hypothetical protein